MNYNLPLSNEVLRPDLIDALIAQTKHDTLLFTAEQLAAVQRLDEQTAADGDLSRGVQDVTGVLAGVKPGAVVPLSAPVQDFAEVMGLAYVQDRRGRTAALSRSEAVASELIDAVDRVREHNRAADHRIVGRLLGYPETATDYFIKRCATLHLPPNQQLPSIRPEVLEGTVRKRIKQFVCSEDYWQKEIDEYIVPLEDSVKEFAPLTYNVFKQEAKKQRCSHMLGRLVSRQTVLQSPFDDAIAVKWVR